MCRGPNGAAWDGGAPLTAREVEVDVVVAGSGPAGSTAAYVAASRGLDTVLVEKRGPPRDKTCGGLLTNACVDLVLRVFRKEVPADVQIPPSPMPVFVAPPSGFSKGFRVPGESVLNVTRRAFDGWLAREAVDRGARLLSDSELVECGPADDRVLVTVRGPGGPRRYRTRYLVGADGIYSRVREQLSPRPLHDRAYYIQEYYPRTGRFEDLFYLLYRGDTSPIYAYVIPKEDLLCLGIGIHKSVPPTFEEGMARLKGWLHEACGFEDRGPVRREGYSVPFGNIVAGHGRVLLAGDAAGFCYPPTGEGITFAIESGAEAAAAIAAGGDGVAQRYASRMAAVAKRIEEAAARTLVLTDEQREARIFSKAGL